MGDRSNIGFHQSTGEILWVYAHWNFNPGHMKAAAAALKAAESRWGDDSYATALAVGHLLENGGRGLTINSRDDNEHKMLLIDWKSGRVSLHPEWGGHPDQTPDPIFTMSFEAFVTKYGG